MYSKIQVIEIYLAQNVNVTVLNNFNEPFSCAIGVERASFRELKCPIAVKGVKGAPFRGLKFI